jgi:hypothetical protein
VRAGREWWIGLVLRHPEALEARDDARGVNAASDGRIAEILPHTLVLEWNSPADVGRKLLSAS